MKYDAILFDLDGTLTESGTGIMNSVRYALTKMGFPIPPEETLRLFVGPPLAEAFQNHCGMSETQAEEAVRCYREYYAERGLFENAVYDGVPEMLSHLTAAGERLILATSKPEHFARRIMAHFGLDRYFAYIGGALTDGTRKEKAEVIAYVLETTGADPVRCLMIGDRCYDVTGAEAFGIPTLGVLWGYGSREELTEAGAMYLAAHPDEIKEIVKNV